MVVVVVMFVLKTVAVMVAGVEVTSCGTISSGGDGSGISRKGISSNCCCGRSAG